VPAVRRFIEIDFAHELVEHRCDPRRLAHLREAAALDDDARLPPQPLNRIGEIGRTAAASVGVLAR
jgi:hypothetical protein